MLFVPNVSSRDWSGPGPFEEQAIGEPIDLKYVANEAQLRSRQLRWLENPVEVLNRSWRKNYRRIRRARSRGERRGSSALGAGRDGRRLFPGWKPGPQPLPRD